MIETISSAGKLFAVILPRDFSAPGVNFFTPHNLSQQLTFISHPPGRLIGLGLSAENIDEVASVTLAEIEKVLHGSSC